MVTFSRQVSVNSRQISPDQPARTSQQDSSSRDLGGPAIPVILEMLIEKCDGALRLAIKLIVCTVRAQALTCGSDGTVLPIPNKLAGQRPDHAGTLPTFGHILLMILFSTPKRPGRGDLRCDRPSEATGGILLRL